MRARLCARADVICLCVYVIICKHEAMQLSAFAEGQVEFSGTFVCFVVELHISLFCS